MNRIKVKLEDLPELPFEKIFNYLRLEDLIRAKAVSRSWYRMFDFKLSSLCFSEHPSEFIEGKGRLLSGDFAQNFISSPNFNSFFDMCCNSILSSLKHLRLCEICLNDSDSEAFACLLNSLAQLNKLDLIRFDWSRKLALKMPVLVGIWIEKESDDLQELKLDAPELHKVKLFARNSLRLELVHPKSVEKLVIDYLDQFEVNKLENLKYLYIAYSRIDFPLLPSLERLEEAHLHNRYQVADLFEQKRRYRVCRVRIFLKGRQLDGPLNYAEFWDPENVAIYRLESLKDYLRFLSQDFTRLAYEIPFHSFLEYQPTIERIPPGLEIHLLSRFTNLKRIIVSNRTEELHRERFLGILKYFENIDDLSFECDQEQDLFDRLPECSNLQSLSLREEPSELDFLFRLKSLNHLHLDWSIDVEFASKVLEQLAFLISFKFRSFGEQVRIKVDIPKKAFAISTTFRRKTVSDVHSAIRFIFEAE